MTFNELVNFYKDFSNSIEKNIVEILKKDEAEDVAHGELTSAWDKSQNVEGRKLGGIAWHSLDETYNKKYLNGRNSGHFDKLKISGELREQIVINTIDLAVKSQSKKYKDVRDNILSYGIDVFSFKNSKLLKKFVYENLIKKLKHG